MSVYTPKTKKRLDSPQNVGKAKGSNAVGTDANFTCGSFVRFTLRIDPRSKEVASVRFQTNGCGFMIAAADVLADAITGKNLAHLHGLERNDLRAKIRDELGTFPADRGHCEEACIEALRLAFANYRAHRIEEFQGEKALICTCFGVSEETIESLIMSEPLTPLLPEEGWPKAGVVGAATGFSSLPIRTVDDITRVCNAGGGCGSCRMLIQEIIDSLSVR